MQAVRKGTFFLYSNCNGSNWSNNVLLQFGKMLKMTY